jgi:hypothetical protein
MTLGPEGLASTRLFPAVFQHENLQDSYFRHCETDAVIEIQLSLELKVLGLSGAESDEHSLCGIVRDEINSCIIAVAP